MEKNHNDGNGKKGTGDYRDPFEPEMNFEEKMVLAELLYDRI